jgi:hypothetical protein
LTSCSTAIAEKRVVTAQALSGTGALRVGGEFIARHYGGQVSEQPMKFVYIRQIKSFLLQERLEPRVPALHFNKMFQA